MTRRDHRDAEPHVLVVHHVDEETREVEWSLEHPGCTEHRDAYGVFEYAYYNCLVQTVIYEIGLLDAFGGDWTPAVGRIEIVGCSTYDDYTHESDTWIEEA